MYGSLFEWSTMKNFVFVGVENYSKLVNDAVFWKTIKNASLWIAVTVPIQATLGFTLAYIVEEKLFNSKLKKGREIFRTVFFLPVVTSVVVVAIVWSQMFQPYQGIITTFVQSLGFSGQLNVLGDSTLAIYGVMLANIWEWTGWSMIMYVAGMAQISSDMKEAAKIDGANTLQEIFYIYIPSLSSVHKSLLMLGVIGSLQTYALVASMTNGGPNRASEMPGTYIFQTGFTTQQMGYACAISIAVLIFALVLTVLQVLGVGAGEFMKKEES